MGDGHLACEGVTGCVWQERGNAPIQNVLAVDRLQIAHAAGPDHCLEAGRIDIDKMALIAIDAGDVSDLHAKMAARRIQRRLDDGVRVEARSLILNTGGGPVIPAA